MTTFEFLMDAAYQSGEPVGIQVDASLLVAMFLSGYLVWCLDGVMIDPDLARELTNTL